MGKNYANRLITGSKVAANLGGQVIQECNPVPCGTLYTPCEILPTSEYQIRPLTRLEPDQQREAWNKADETAPNGKVKSKHVANTVKELTAPAPSQTLHLFLTRDSPLPGPCGEHLLAHRPPLTLGCPLPWPWWGCSGPQRRRFIVPGGRSGGASQVAGAPAGEFGQGKGDATPCRFLPACCSWRQHRPVPHPWPRSTDIKNISQTSENYR